MATLVLKSIRRNWLHPRKRGIRPQFARSSVSQKSPLHNKTFESRHFSSVKQQIRLYHYSTLLWSMSTTGNSTNFALLSPGQMAQWRVKNAPAAFHWLIAAILLLPDLLAASLLPSESCSCIFTSWTYLQSSHPSQASGFWSFNAHNECSQKRDFERCKILTEKY